ASLLCWMTFTATMRSSLSCLARKTIPMPPAPTASRSSYPGIQSAGRTTVCSSSAEAALMVARHLMGFVEFGKNRLNRGPIGGRYADVGVNGISFSIQNVGGGLGQVVSNAQALAGPALLVEQD